MHVKKYRIVAVSCVPSSSKCTSRFRLTTLPRPARLGGDTPPISFGVSILRPHPTKIPGYTYMELCSGARAGPTSRLWVHTAGQQHHQQQRLSAVCVAYTGSGCSVQCSLSAHRSQ